MKKNQAVKLNRSMLPTSLASALPNFIYWNNGKVAKIEGGRVLVTWSKEDKFWFDAEAVEVA